MSTVTLIEPGSRGRTWTVLSLLEWSGSYLAGRGFDEWRLTAELLLAEVLGVPRLHLYLQFDRPLNADELARFKALFVRRLAHEPLQYILGQTEFMGLRFVVDRRVLIPRPETEEMVGCAIEFVQSRRTGGAEILDIGTGSGNVAVALAKFLPSSTVISIDVSRDCLEVARVNAEALGVMNVSFVECDMRDDILSGRRFDLVVANPPYVALHEFAKLQREVREFEPQLALTDGGDGFLFVRRTAELAAARLKPGGALFMEIAYNQGEEARMILSAAGLRNVEVRKDFGGNPRIVIGTLEAS